MTRSTTRQASTTKLVSVRSRGAVAVDAILALILIALLPQTLNFGDAARRFPLAVTCVLLGLIALDLVIELLPAARRRLGFLEAEYIDASASGDRSAQEEADATAGEAGSDEAKPTPHRKFRKFSQWAALGWLTAAGVGMYALGYLLWTPIFLGAFLLWSRVPLKVAIGITAVMSLFNYLVFYQYLGLR